MTAIQQLVSEMNKHPEKYGDALYLIGNLETEDKVAKEIINAYDAGCINTRVTPQLTTLGADYYSNLLKQK